MELTKYNHACVLVKTPTRTGLFDPGALSEGALDPASIDKLDDIIITHEHFDHLSLDLVKKLVTQFPDVKITSTASVVKQLSAEGISAETNESDAVKLFTAPHGAVEPLFPTPDNVGVHYMGVFSHPGDSFEFAETKAVLVLPVDGPWGGTSQALALALKLEPKFVVPIHDGAWNDDWREMIYPILENTLKKNGIEFLQVKNGQTVTINI